MSEILVQIVGGMVTVVRGPVTVMVDTALDLVSVSRERSGGEIKEPPEEYIRGGDGRKITAAPPEKPELPFAVPEVAPVPDEPLHGLRDPSLDPRARILAETPARKNDLVDHIEKKSGGNGGTPELSGNAVKIPPAVNQPRRAALIGWIKKTETTQRELAKQTGMYVSDVNKHVCGRKNISEYSLARYAKAFGVTVDEMIAKAKLLEAAASRDAEALAAEWPHVDVPGPSPEEQSPPPSTSPASPPQKKPAGSRPGKAKKEEPEVELEPLVAALCRTCRERGDGDCHGCRVALALRRARIQETPGVITLNARASACANCDHNGRSKCRRCKLGAYQRVQELFDRGESVEESVSAAWGEYRAEVKGK